MSRPEKTIPIPFFPLKSISELLEEGKTHIEIGKYFGVSGSTITRRIQKEKEAEK